MKKYEISNNLTLEGNDHFCKLIASTMIVRENTTEIEIDKREVKDLIEALIAWLSETDGSIYQ